MGICIILCPLVCKHASDSDNDEDAADDLQHLSSEDSAGGCNERGRSAARSDDAPSEDGSGASERGRSAARSADSPSDHAPSDEALSDAAPTELVHRPKQKVRDAAAKGSQNKKGR